MALGSVTLFSTRAHVFQIDPKTETSWSPKEDSAIPISFVANNSENRRELSIIGTNKDGEIVLDCAILPSTIFTKRAQKFVQWNNHTGIIYGLGFNSETELNEFMDAFRQLRQEINMMPADSLSQPQAASSMSQPSQIQHQSMMTTSQVVDSRFVIRGGAKPQQAQPQLQTNNSSSEMNGRDLGSAALSRNNSGGDAAAAANHYPNTMSNSGHQQQHQDQQNQNRRQPVSHDHLDNDTNNNNNNNSLNNGIHYPRSQSMIGMQQQQQQHQQKTSSGIGARMSPDLGSQDEAQIREQLRYENERLKQALEESFKNAGVWKSELINLRTNNGKLTQALQESKAHVAEWEKELSNLRDENKDLKTRIMALESSGENELTDDHKLEIQKYKNYIEELQNELRKKDSELDQVQQSMEQLEIKSSSKENGRSDDPTSMEVVISSYQKQKLDSITSKLEATVNELDEIRKEYAQFSDKLYH